VPTGRDVVTAAEHARRDVVAHLHRNLSRAISVV
jgi:hypothetical protein